MQKSSINPAIVQELFESASNAADKGQAAYHTPPEWARVLALPLPDHRPIIVDLTCGDGALLKGARNATTRKLLGADIDLGEKTVSEQVSECVSGKRPVSLTHSPTHPLTAGKWAGGMIQADLTRLYPLLVEVDWQADLFVLNPPWDLHWHRDNEKLKIQNSKCGPDLSALAESVVPAVAEAFRNKDPRLGRGEIDSTIATLMIALDRCSLHGEGYLIANESTLQRLILGGPHAPHRALAAHVWAHLVVEGNLCQTAGEKVGKWVSEQFQTGVIWFAQSHSPTHPLTHLQATSLAEAAKVCQQLANDRLHLREGSEIREWNETKDTPTGRR